MRQRRQSKKNLLTDRILSEIKQRRLKKYPCCVTCGSTYRLELAHVFSRSCKSIIFEWDNCFIQCHICNVLHESNAEPLFSFTKLEVGEERFEELKILSWQTKKWYAWELEELLKEIQ